MLLLQSFTGHHMAHRWILRLVFFDETGGRHSHVWAGFVNMGIRDRSIDPAYGFICHV